MNSQQSTTAIPARYAEGIRHQALQFFGIAFAVVSTASGICWGLCKYLGRVAPTDELAFPPAFIASTILLALGSLALHRALRFVQLEKQVPFRRWLVISSIMATLFIGVQCYALWSMFPEHRAHESASLGVTAFIVCLATLHGLHFLVATLFVAVIISRSLSHRYDHEYHWGVKACAWFWDFLGIVWLGILFVIAIAL